MRDIAEKPPLAAYEAGQARGHLIHTLAEHAEFVAPLFVHAHVEFAFGDAGGGAGHLRDGARDAPDQGYPEQRGKRQRARRSAKHEGVIEKEAADIERRRDRNQGKQPGRTVRIMQGETDQNPVPARIVCMQHHLASRRAPKRQVQS